MDSVKLSTDLMLEVKIKIRKLDGHIHFSVIMLKFYFSLHSAGCST